MLPYTVRVALKTDSNAPGNASRHLSEERLVQMNEEKPNSDQFRFVKHINFS